MLSSYLKFKTENVKFQILKDRNKTEYAWPICISESLFLLFQAS